MKKSLKYYEKQALSDKDISRMLDHKVKIELYPNLHKYTNIDQLLGPYGSCVLLFESKPKYGHWCCIFKVNDRLIEFFNPYSGWPDDSLLKINIDFRKASNQLIPKLSQLMVNSPYELSYNEYQFQEYNPDIRTCGRHCVVRLIKRDLFLDEYVEYLNNIGKKYNINDDQIVTLMTI